MFYLSFIEMWDEVHENREKMLQIYIEDEYLSRVLSKAEIILIRNLLEEVVPTQNIEEFCAALHVTAEDLEEMLGVPTSVIMDWKANGIPDHTKKMITYIIATGRIEDGRCHTCQGCGEFFFTTDSKEVMCEDCHREIGAEALDRYVLHKLRDLLN